MYPLAVALWLVTVTQYRETWLGANRNTASVSLSVPAARPNRCGSALMSGVVPCCHVSGASVSPPAPCTSQTTRCEKSEAAPATVRAATNMPATILFMLSVSKITSI